MTRTLLVAAALLASFIPTRASAWMRMRYEDQQVVERSELIVVGRLKVDSIRYVAHERKPPSGRSWEHHATLVVDETLKGTAPVQEMKVIIHYGLTPVVGGHWEQDGNSVDLRHSRKRPADLVEIIDTGNSAMSFVPLVPD